MSKICNVSDIKKERNRNKESRKEKNNKKKQTKRTIRKNRENKYKIIDWRINKYKHTYLQLRLMISERILINLCINPLKIPVFLKKHEEVTDKTMKISSKTRKIKAFLQKTVILCKNNLNQGGFCTFL